ncbi:MAG: hypothetical protein MI865_13530 [Proteobacteria bacterium]|nr:hypothetical protein [Pseudomonadota bacterium]
MNSIVKVEFPWAVVLLYGGAILPFLLFMTFMFSKENIYLAFFFALLTIFPVMLLVIPISTKYSDVGIKQLSIYGWIECAWEEISKVESHKFGYHLYSNKRKLIISPMLYTNGNKIDKLIHNKLKDVEWINS